MKWYEHFFKPSSLITLIILIIFLIMAYVAVNNPDANNSFFEIATDAIKILCGSLGGAVAGEKWVEKRGRRK